MTARRRKKSTSRSTRAAIKLGPRFLRAFQFAAEKHAGQTRKASTIPYIAHLMGVASLVLEAGGDEDLAIAALLHDVVEDCGGAPMLKEVRRRFGTRVAKVVDGCTDADTDPKPPWRERKEKYIRRLKKEDADTRLVSAADKLNNVRSILSDYRADRRICLVTVQRRTRGHSLVLSDFAGRISAAQTEPHHPRLGTGGERTGVAGRRDSTRMADERIPPSRHEAMARMIDQIRASKLPSNMMQFAARGALQVPPAENIEILVYLALHNKVFGDLARMTLAGWDEKSSLAAAADPQTPPEVLDYFISPDNLRPELLPALLENPSVPEAQIVKLAMSAHAGND